VQAPDPRPESADERLRANRARALEGGAIPAQSRAELDAPSSRTRARTLLDECKVMLE